MTIFVKSKRVMVSKEELRKLDKEQLVNLVSDLLIQSDALASLVHHLQDEINKLKTHKNSGNSSLPPSHDLFSIRNQSLRGKSDKKSGGQPGHKGETLRMSPHPDKIVEHLPESVCPQCGRIHARETLQLTGQRQVIDIPFIKASFTEHQIYQAVCTCGHVSTGNYPAGINAPVQYGNNLISLVAYLSSRQFVPYNRLSELIKNITNVSMSEGTIFNLLNKAANMVLPIYRGIKEELSKATVVGGDETGMKVEKNKFWAWTWQNLHATYITISKSRGFVTVENTFPDGFRNATFISDSLGAQLKTTALRHQLCLAHLLRELNFFEEVYHHKWATEMKDLLMRAIRLKDSMTLKQYAGPFEERMTILHEFEKMVNQPLPESVPKIITFQKRLKKRGHQVFPFLFYPDVPYHNNGSELAIRNVKVKQKVSGGFRSERGAEIFAILRSVVDTIIKKGGEPFDSIRFALNVAARKNEYLSQAIRN